MLSRLLIAALWSPAGKGLTPWLSFVTFNCVFVTFPYGILGQVWYLIVSIPDLYPFLTFIKYIYPPPLSHRWMRLLSFLRQQFCFTDSSIVVAIIVCVGM